jgi:transcriptional regulator with XRE-family HTH domain
METAAVINSNIARHVRTLRSGNGWTLDELARHSGVSRASLSRIENAEVSPTAEVLGSICAAFGITLSRLMLMAEEQATALVKPDQQPVWSDPETGFRRRAVSPPAAGLMGEVLECELKPATRISYERPPRAGLEHHLVLLEGELALTIEGAQHVLKAGDTLRYQLHGASLFETPPHAGARYFLFMV